MLDLILKHDLLETILRDSASEKPSFFGGASALPAKITLAEIDDYVNRNSSQLPDIVKVLLNGRPFDLTWQAKSTGSSEKQAIAKALKAGATLKIEELESRHPLVSAICLELSQRFGGNTYAKVFVTPPNEKGFPAHFDASNVFVVQLAGSKHWTTYGRSCDHPIRGMARSLTDEEIIGATKTDVILRAGDVLYVPAGVGHSAACSGEHSVHISFGIEPITPVEIIRRALTSLARSTEVLRRPFYPGAPDQAAILVAAISSFTEALHGLSADDEITNLRRSMNAVRPVGDDRSISGTLAAANLLASTKVTRAVNRQAELSVNGNSIHIFPSAALASGTEFPISAPYIELPLHAHEEAKSLLEADRPIAICDLPGLLDEESKVLLAKELASHGLIEAVN